VRVEDWVLRFVALAGRSLFLGEVSWVLGAVHLLFVGVGGWRDSPELEEAEALVEVGVGVEVKLVGEEGGGVDGVCS